MLPKCFLSSRRLRSANTIFRSPLARKAATSRGISSGPSFAVAIHDDDSARLELLVRSGEANGDGALMPEVRAQREDVDRCECLIRTSAERGRRRFDRAIVHEPDRCVKVGLVERAIDLGQEQFCCGPVVEDGNEDEKPYVYGRAGASLL
jgi:hypothetical protein